MMIQVHNRCSDFSSYRAARVKSLFNAESGCNFDLEAELPADDPGWKIGVIVGPSGSGKSSIGRQFWPGVGISNLAAGWPADAPIVDAIAPAGDFNAVTGALAAVGLGSVPAWLRPYQVLSVGEQFRAGLARIVAEQPRRIVIDEFTSTLDRTVAHTASAAFARAWRRGNGQALLLTCHRDTIPWIAPDWVYDIAENRLTQEGVQRPRLQLKIYQTDWRYWPLFQPYHYLKLPNMVAARCYVGTIAGELVCHAGVTTKYKGQGALDARIARFVVMPQWQGLGIGTKFLRRLAEWNLTGHEAARLPGHPMTTIISTSHPGLARALRRDRRWRQISANLYGEPRARCIRTLAVSNARKLAAEPEAMTVSGAAYGGHFRAVQGFRYVGAEGYRVTR